MKLGLVLFALLLVYPAGRILRGKDKWLRWGAMVFAALPFLHIEALSVQFFYDDSPDADFRGDTRGLEVAIIDLAAFAFFIALPRLRHRASFFGIRFFYLLIAVASAFVSPVPLYSAFAIWKIFRAYLFMHIVVRFFQVAGGGPALIRGLALGVTYTGALGLYQRYGQGMYRVLGAFAHPNSLGMMMLLCYGLLLSLLLADQSRRLAAVATVAAALSILMTQSRTAIALVVVGTVVIFLFSLRQGFTRVKMVVAAVGVVAALGVFAVAADTLIERFFYAPEVSGIARDRFESAAGMIAEDHPFGTGINSFSHFLLHRGYAERAEVFGVDEGGLVHNIYWLSRAEMGFFGLFAFVLTIIGPLVLAAKTWLRASKRIVRDMSLGIAFSICAFSAQGFYEWAARQTPLLFMYWMIVGILVGISREDTAKKVV